MCAQAAKRDNHTLGCTKASTSSSSGKALSGEEEIQGGPHGDLQLLMRAAEVQY